MVSDASCVSLSYAQDVVAWSLRHECCFEFLVTRFIRVGTRILYVTVAIRSNRTLGGGGGR